MHWQKTLLNALYGYGKYGEYNPLDDHELCNTPFDELIDKLLEPDVRTMKEMMKGGFNMDKKYQDIHIMFKSGSISNIRQVKNVSIYTDTCLTVVSYDDTISHVRRNFNPSDIISISID